MRITVVPCLLAAAALLLACADEKNPVVVDALIPVPIQRENVLTNLELAYNKRAVTRYAELLDANFTFYFSPGDVGGTVPDQWGRVEELRVASKLFDKNLNEPPYPTCRSIRMDLDFESGVHWVEVIPEDFPTETWYTTTLPYDFTFEMNPDITLLEAPGAHAQLTVRNAGTDNAPKWLLVEMRDLGGSTASQNPLDGGTTTWGGVKAMYK